MIKSLLNADEEPLPETKSITQEKPIIQPPNHETSEMPEVRELVTSEDRRDVFEIPEDARFFVEPTENPVKIEQPRSVFESEIPAVELQKEENLLIDPTPVIEEKAFEPVEAEPEKVATQSFQDEQATMFQTNYTPETPGETVHNSGLAYSAAIVLFASVVFMMMLGWFVGQLIGNPTGGIVGGIILGAIIGFIQFFRITSSIFKK